MLHTQQTKGHHNKQKLDAANGYGAVMIKHPLIFHHSINAGAVR